MKKRNIFDIEDSRSDTEEVFEDLVRKSGLLIERIISTGQATPEDEWYDQEQDEWVILLQGKSVLEFENKEQLTLGKGDWIFIPAHLRHRVAFTSTNPECIWLAVHH